MLADHRAHPRNLVLDTERGKLYWLEGLSKTGALMSADTSGKNLTTLVDRLKTPHGLAIDAHRDELYYFEQHRIVRVKADGSDEKLIVNGQRQTGSFASAMQFDATEDKLYWNVGFGLITARVDRDGSSPSGHQLHPMGGVQGFALDAETKKIYFLNSPYGRVERANLGGSQEEVLAVFPIEDSAGFTRGVSGAVAVDVLHKQLYYSGGKGKGTSDSPRIIRMGLPPVLTPTVRPAPPLITAIPVGELRAGADVTVMGQHFTHATAVSFVNDSTCKHALAKFHVVDDQTLAIAVPRMTDACKHPVIVLQTPSGVTMNLRKEI